MIGPWPSYGQHQCFCKRESNILLLKISSRLAVLIFARAFDWKSSGGGEGSILSRGICERLWIPFNRIVNLTLTPSPPLPLAPGPLGVLQHPSALPSAVPVRRMLPSGRQGPPRVICFVCLVVVDFQTKVSETCDWNAFSRDEQLRYQFAWDLI